MAKQRGRPRKWTKKTVAAEAAALHEWIQRRLGEGKPIFLGRFAAERGYSRQRFTEWVESFPREFADTYTVAKAWQETDLVEGGLDGRYSQTFAFRALKNLAGWRDQQDLTHANPDGSPVTFIMPDRPPSDAGDHDETDEGEDAH